MLSTRLGALVAAVGAWLFTLAASAQATMDQRTLDDWDWMSSGLTPLLAIMGLGVLFALVAAAIAYAIGKMPERRWRGEA